MMEQLIHAFEEEKFNLERFIREALLNSPEGPDYLTALQYEKGLDGTNHALGVLRTLEDRYYRKKEWHRHCIRRFREAVREGRSSYALRFLEEEKALLSVLEMLPSDCPDKSYILRETFRELTAGAISGFKWVLRKNLYFRFLYKPGKKAVFCDLVFTGRENRSSIETGRLSSKGFVPVSARRLRLKWPCHKEGVEIDGLMVHLSAVIFNALCIFPEGSESHLELF
ncbi:hypothetical protein [Niabella drilacis]|nr:hypothetical protein [Niabella drilacis]